jgi:hypothetical protein
VHHPDYDARAIQANDQAERAVTREMTDGWRRVAESYRKLARQLARECEKENQRQGINRRNGNETC